MVYKSTELTKMDDLESFATKRGCHTCLIMIRDCVLKYDKKLAIMGPLFSKNVNVVELK